jgi:putative DNA primase/helicase
MADADVKRMIDEAIAFQSNPSTISKYAEKQQKSKEEKRKAKLEALSKEKYFVLNPLTGKASFVPKLLAEDIMNIHAFATRKDSGEIYRQHNGFYRPDGKVTIHALCAKALENKYHSYHAKEVIDYIKAVTYSEFKEPPLNLINVKNGIVNIQTKSLKPHDPKYKFLQQIPHEYDPKATCPEWEKFFYEVTGNNEDARTLKNTIAYTLLRRNPYHKATICIGTGANGKTVFLNGIECFLGKENVSNRSLHELIYDRFATSDLYGKLANISGDLPNTALKHTGIFKNIVGEDTITVQKKFLQAFRTKVYAKLIFACNQPPEPKTDESLAFFRRWNIVVFPKVFIGDECDPTKLQKLTTEQEMSGLLNIAIDHLQALIVSGGFKENGSAEEIKKQYMRKANPVQSFAEDILIEDETGFIKTEELHQLYVNYCKINNFSAEGKNKFRGSFEKLGYLYTRNPKGKRGFSGIKAKEQKTQQGLDNYGKENLPKMPKNHPFLTGKKSTQKGKGEVEEIQGDNPRNYGKFGKNQIEQTFPKNCSNCGKPLPNDVSEIMFYKGEPMHKHCNAKILNEDLAKEKGED